MNETTIKDRLARAMQGAILVGIGFVVAWAWTGAKVESCHLLASLDQRLIESQTHLIETYEESLRLLRHRNEQLSQRQSVEVALTNEVRSIQVIAQELSQIEAAMKRQLAKQDEPTAPQPSGAVWLRRALEAAVKAR